MTRTALRTALIVIAVVALAAVPTALAGKGGGAGKPGGGGKPSGGAATGSFKLVLLNSTDGLAHYGQDITFTVNSTATYPMVDVDCYQGATKVFHQGVGFYGGYPFTQIFTLNGWAWPVGPADCNARLYSQSADGRTQQTLATMSFHVYA